MFANIVLADEINRASPKTQSSLLEVMDEGRVTTDSVARAVPTPFMVIATQNPIDMDGTYPLPEAQLDRFLMKIKIGYPDATAEAEVLRGYRAGVTIEALPTALSRSDLHYFIDSVSTVHVDRAIDDYIIRLTDATRNHPSVQLGASPRASLALLRTSRAYAASMGRGFVTPEDISDLAKHVLAHRLILRPEADLHGVTALDIIDGITADVPVPVRQTQP